MNKLKSMLTCMMSVVMLVFACGPALAEAQDGGSDAAQATRTIMLYAIGSNLETEDAFMTGNLLQILGAEHAPDIRFVAMTGGAEAWQTEAEYLEGAEAVGQGANNQLWLCSGKNADNAENGHGKMTLLTDGPADIANASMAEEGTLLGFINYAAQKFPAKAYDLILWDHGGGPKGGFGMDELHDWGQTLSVGAIARTVKQSAVKRLDILNFDACLMASAEIAAVLSECADHLVFSPESEPGYGQEYGAWLNALAADPQADSMALCRWIVDAFYAFYSDEACPAADMSATLAAVDCGNFRNRMLPLLTELGQTMNREATVIGGVNRKLNFYDELKAIDYAYHYGDTGLYDLGSLMNALGVSRSEIDNTESLDALTNAYTDLAGRIAAILADQDGTDDDVIYFRATQSAAQPVNSRVQMVRDESGALVNPESIQPAGLSLFYLPVSVEDTLEYMKAVTEMFAVSEDGDTQAMLRAFAVASVRNLLICQTGQTVDALLENGDASVTYKDVWDSWTEKRELSEYEIELYKQQMKLDAEITGMRASLWDEYISRLVDFLNRYGAVDAETWLALVATQQSAEAVSADRTQAQAVDWDGDKQKDAYRITVASPMALVRDVSVNIEADTLLERDEWTRQFLGEHVSLGKIHGFPAVEGFLDEMNNNYDNVGLGLLSLYQSETSAYDLVTALDSWYELIDPDGGRHVVSIGEIDYANESALKIPVRLELTELDEDGYPKQMMGYLMYSDGHFTGFMDSEDAARVLPLTSQVFGGAKVTTSQMIPLDFLGLFVIPVFDEISEPFTLPSQPAEEWGVALTMSKIADIHDLKDGKVLESAVITDVYGYEHGIDAALEAADARAAEGGIVPSLEGAQITVTGVLDWENEVEPEVTVVYAGETLERGDSYNVAYEQTASGEWRAVVYGVGDYIGYQAVPVEVAEA